jgi:hypothetical protein
MGGLRLHEQGHSQFTKYAMTWTPNTAIGPNWNDFITTTTEFRLNGNAQFPFVLDSAAARVQFTLKVPGLGFKGYNSMGVDGKAVVPVTNDGDLYSPGDQDTITVTQSLCNLIRITQGRTIICTKSGQIVDTRPNSYWWYNMPPVSLSQMFTNYLELTKYSSSIISKVTDAVNKHTTMSFKIKVFMADSRGSFNTGKEFSCIKKDSWIS